MQRETHTAKLISITPKAEEQIVYMARVSNPSNQNNMETAPRLIKYLIKHKHWSPFEMASMQVEIETTRAVAARSCATVASPSRNSPSAIALLISSAISVFHIFGLRTSRTSRPATTTWTLSLLT